MPISRLPCSNTERRSPASRRLVERWLSTSLRLVIDQPALVIEQPARRIGSGPLVDFLKCVRLSVKPKPLRPRSRAWRWGWWRWRRPGRRKIGIFEYRHSAYLWELRIATTQLLLRDP